jgi:superkiller protein 3
MQRKFIYLIFVLAAIALGLRLQKIIPISYNNRGMGLLERGDYQQAIEYFEKALRLRPNFSEAHYNLAVAYTQTKDYTRAIQEYIKTRELNPSYIKARFNLAILYYDELQMFEEAAKELKEILRISPDYMKAKELLDRISLDYSATALNLGLGYLEKNQYQQAEEQFNKVLEIKPDFVVAKYNLALLYLKDSRAGEAKLKLEEIIRENPSFVLAYRQLGSIYFDEGNYAQAARFYREVVNLKPNDLQAHNDLAQTYAKLEDYDQAIKEFQSALLIEPSHLNVLYSLASTYRDKGDYQSAIFYYKKLQGLSPDYPFVHTELAGIYGKLGMETEEKQQAREAIDEYRKYLISHPDDLVSLGHLAEAYLQVGEIELAKETMARLFEIKSDYLPAYLTYGHILESQGEKEKAREYFEKARNEPGFSLLAEENIRRIEDKLPAKEEGADIIYLKNGRSLEGRILDETDEAIVLEVGVGETQGRLTIPNREIERIEKGVSKVNP